MPGALQIIINLFYVAGSITEMWKAEPPERYTSRNNGCYCRKEQITVWQNIRMVYLSGIDPGLTQARWTDLFSVMLDLACVRPQIKTPLLEVENTRDGVLRGREAGRKKGIIKVKYFPGCLSSCPSQPHLQPPSGTYWYRWLKVSLQGAVGKTCSPPL